MTDACRAWRGDLAVRALGVVDVERDAALDAHLDGCPDCRAELDDLRAVSDVLTSADPDRLSAPPPDPRLGERVVARIAAAERGRRRRRWTRVAAGAAAAAVLVVVAIVATTATDGDDDVVRVELAGQLNGDAALEPHDWGTEVTLEVRGMDRDEVYWLWLSDDDGDRVVAGTLTGVDGTATAVLTSALPLDEARRIWMTDEDDAVVLDALIRSD